MQATATGKGADFMATITNNGGKAPGDNSTNSGAASVAKNHAQGAHSIVNTTMWWPPMRSLPTRTATKKVCAPRQTAKVKAAHTLELLPTKKASLICLLMLK